MYNGTHENYLVPSGFRVMARQHVSIFRIEALTVVTICGPEIVHKDRKQFLSQLMKCKDS